MLPDDVLLEIFDFHVDGDMGEDFEPHRTEEWVTLAHVCRRWRNVVFQSPHRLNLRLLCTPNTPARDALDIWPPLPLIIRNFRGAFFDGIPGVDNIIAALEHNDRVCQVKLHNLSISQLKCVAAAMHEPFPELTDLQLRTLVYDGPRPILPDSFLDGTASRLRSLELDYVPFLGLPKLLLSTTHIVNLTLHDIPRSGYIPPEAMATSLSALTSLESLFLHFRCPGPRPALESRHPPPLTCSTIPSLITFGFKGTSEYLEEILARIDAPRLNHLGITFFNQIIFDTPQFLQFINRSPTLSALTRGRIAFNSKAIIIEFLSPTSDYGELNVRILCTASEWQLSSLEQVCASSLPPLSLLEDLYIFEDQEYPPRWQDDVENTLWLDLLRPFVAVKNLYISEAFVPRIAPALQELIGGRTTEVLPTLDNILLRSFRPGAPRPPLHEGVGKFVAARRLTGHPVAVSH
jgi:F-box-like